jgi:hypothetical protein
LDYSSFNALLGLLFFGSVLLFGVLQLAALRRDRRQAEGVTRQGREAFAQPTERQER